MNYKKRKSGVKVAAIDLESIKFNTYESSILSSYISLEKLFRLELNQWLFG